MRSTERADAADRLLACGVTTWPSLAALEGDVLGIINSPAGDEQAVSNLFDAIEQCVPPTRLHVIATPGWQPWLRERGCSEARILFSADAAGRELELNGFLESLEALRWILARRFAVIVGSAPHSLYNEEVKDTFERRVAIVLGTGHFFAHALPQPYLFVLDLAGLLQRFNRGRKTADYSAVCRAIVDDLHHMWTEGGKPWSSDTGPLVDVTKILARHLGASVLSWDEASPLPLRPPDAAEPAAEFVTYFATVLHHAADRAAALHEEFTRAHEERAREIDLRDRLLAQLAAAHAHDVGARDAIIGELHAQQARDVRDGTLAELEAVRAREIAARDAIIAELHAQQAREVGKRDGMLAELEAIRAREIGARDATIAELQARHDAMLADREAAAALVEAQGERLNAQEAIIDELRRELAFATRGWRGWIIGQGRKTS